MHDGEPDERRLPAVEQSSGGRSGAHSLAGFDRLGDYVLCEVLGEGGMGQVYRAYDLGQDREVALKILSPHLRLDEKFRRRFQRESRIVARLNEPHIIPIHHYGEIDGRLYLDMRLVEGEDLRSRLRDRGPLTPREATDILAQVADALDAAHEAKVTHRDVKPSNILLSQRRSGVPFVYLVDFGIARSGSGTTLTAPTQAVGTAEYMAPERFLGTGTDTRIDVYSLTCVLYECLTGRTPFPGEEFAAQCHAHIELPPPRVTEAVPGLPAELDDIVAKGMAKRPEERYPTAGELIRHLARVTGPRTPAAERASSPQDTPSAGRTPPTRTSVTRPAPRTDRPSPVPKHDVRSQRATGAPHGTDRGRPDHGEPPRRRSLKPPLSRKVLVLVATVVAVLCGGLLVFGLRSTHPSTPTTLRPPSTGQTPGQGSGLLSALFTTALPAADDTNETLSPPEQRLASSSHFAGHCRPMQSVENRTVRAAVHCPVVNGGSRGGPTVANLYQFAGSDTLDRAISAQTARAGKGSCTGARPVAQNWPSGSAAPSGRMYCFTDRSGPVVAWSDNGKVTLSVVGGSRMPTLYRWWSGNR
jgi:serine/threonine-protein kinase